MPSAILSATVQTQLHRAFASSCVVETRDAALSRKPTVFQIIYKHSYILQVYIRKRASITYFDAMNGKRLIIPSDQPSQWRQILEASAPAVQNVSSQVGPTQAPIVTPRLRTCNSELREALLKRRVAVEQHRPFETSTGTQ